jgi:hypothetical protein
MSFSAALYHPLLLSLAKVIAGADMVPFTSLRGAVKPPLPLRERLSVMATAISARVAFAQEARIVVPPDIGLPVASEKVPFESRGIGHSP